MKRLKKKLTAKLKGNAGESLGEVLIALLIAALALVMLASVIDTSARIITRSKATMKDYYDASDELVQQQAKEEGSKIDTGTTYVSIKNGETYVILRSEKPGPAGEHVDDIPVNSFQIKDTYTGGNEVAAYQLP